MPTLVEFILTISAVSYLTWILKHTEGPFDWFDKVRSLQTLEDSILPGWHKIFWPLKTTVVTVGKMADCPWCASFWVSLLVVGLFLYSVPVLLYVSAVAGFVNAIRTLFQQIALPRENKIRIDTATYLKKNFGEAVAAKYLELGDIQAAFQAVEATRAE